MVEIHKVILPFKTWVLTTLGALAIAMLFMFIATYEPSVPLTVEQVYEQESEKARLHVDAFAVDYEEWSLKGQKILQEAMISQIKVWEAAPTKESAAEPAPEES